MNQINQTNKTNQITVGGLIPHDMQRKLTSGCLHDLFPTASQHYSQTDDDTESDEPLREIDATETRGMALQAVAGKCRFQQRPTGTKKKGASPRQYVEGPRVRAC